VPLVPDASLTAWQVFLAERELAASLAGVQGAPAQLAPSGGVTIALTIDRADQGWLFAYRLGRAAGAPPLAPSDVRFVAGLIAQRLPGVRCVRCAAAPVTNVFDAWFLVRALPVPRAESAENPQHVRWRALAFAPTMTQE
jgi:hypothetical protein